MTQTELCQEWQRLKDVEKEAAEKRVQIEAALIVDLGVREEGAQTHTIETFKVSITGKVNRKLLLDRWKDIELQIPVELRPIKTKVELDEVGFKYLRDNNQAVYQLVAQAVESKPGKPYVVITEKETA